MTSPDATQSVCRHCRQEIRLGLSANGRDWKWIHLISRIALCADGSEYAEPAA